MLAAGDRARVVRVGRERQTDRERERGPRKKDDEPPRTSHDSSADLTLGWLEPSMHTFEIIDSFFIHPVCA